MLQPNRQINHIVQKSDIGVVTPYKMQCKKITQACRYRKWNDITIGTSETFQGKEKPIMIVSTVRAGGKYLGFVNDPRVSQLSTFLAKYLTFFEKNLANECRHYQSKVPFNHSW